MWNGVCIDEGILLETFSKFKREIDWIILVVYDGELCSRWMPMNPWMSA
jgi:hypothetical protein